MAVNLSPVGGVAGQFFDNNGDPLVGGKLFTYAAGTTTPQVTYTSSSGATPNSNPIILNAGGRVPSEIWLTDGLVYKFVLYSSTDQMIGSWDNIVGINSNFVNFVTSEEVQIATAGQTVFTLTTMSYQPGINNLVVYVDGVNQVEGGSYSFVETNSTTVTFTSGLHLGAVVKFVSAETVTTIGSNAAAVAYEPAGSGAQVTTVQAKLRETVSVKDFGAVDTPANATAALTAALAAHDCVFVNAGTYDPIDLSANNKTLVMDCGVVFKLPDNTSPSGSEIVTSVLTISGDNVSIFGDFVVDGNGNNNAWGTSGSIQGSLNITGDDCFIADKVTVQFAYGPGVSVWNGVDINTGNMVNGLHINEIEIVSPRRYSAYFWGMNDFTVGKVVKSGAGLGGANSTDTRLRTGTQQSSSAYCQNGSFGVIQGLVTYETRTRNCHIGRHENLGAGSKAENVQNCVWDQIIVESPVVGVSYAWVFADEFVSDPSDDIRCKNNSIGLLYVKNATYSSGPFNRVVGINDSQNIRIDSLIIEDSASSVSVDFWMRDTENVFIDQCILKANGAGRGYFEEGGYVRRNVVINNLVSTGHATNDIEQNSGNTIINKINDDAVRLFVVVQGQVRNIITNQTITVGSGADFPSIFAALQFVSEQFNPVLYARSGINVFPRVTIELQSGYVWNDAVVIDGVNLGWVTIKPAMGVTITCGGVINIQGTNGAVCPCIEGSYTKNGNGSIFVDVSLGAQANFINGTLNDFINVPARASQGAALNINGTVFTKNTGASVAPTAIQSNLGGHIVAVNTVTDSRFDVFQGSVIVANGSTGTLNQTANTITANGIIYK